MKNITTNIDKWNKQRLLPDGAIGMLLLPLPNNLKVKGYALDKVIIDSEGNELECKTRALADSDSLMHFDMSECYILDYTMNIMDTVPLKDDYSPDFSQPHVFRISRSVRFAGEAIAK